MRKPKGPTRRAPPGSAPLEIAPHIEQLPTPLRNDILRAKGKGVLRNFMTEAIATPHGAKLNCYAHFLTLPKAYLQERIRKTQPGDKCRRPEVDADAPLLFHDRRRASKQLIKRILCDNPGVVHYIKPLASGYPRSVLGMRLPKGYVLGCCIVGANDYHFLRREGIDEVLSSLAFRDIWSKQNAHGVKGQLERLRRAGEEYCYSHVAGWSGRMKVVDADQRVITNPVDRAATGSAVRRLLSNRCNHAYPSLHYDTFVGFFILKARAATTNPDNMRPRNERAKRRSLLEQGLTPRTISEMNARSRASSRVPPPPRLLGGRPRRVTR